MHFPIGLIIRARAKTFKYALNGLIHYIWVDSNMLLFMMGPKQDHVLVNGIKKAFQFVNFNMLIDLCMRKPSKFANFRMLLPNKGSPINNKLIAFPQENKLLFVFLIDLQD